MKETGHNKEHIDYLLGKLPEAQRDALERELEQDPDLLAELEKVEATEDSMLQWLRDSFPAARYQNDPHLQALLKNLENSVAELASGNGEAGPVRTTSPVEPLTHETRAIHGSQDDTSQDGHSGHLAPPPLKRLGRYRIESTIGQGGMGAVYLAHDEKLDRPVAMKIPFMGVQADQQVLERFMQEARSAARLHHRNICPIFDVGEIDGQPYLTMALISGKTLATWVGESHSASEIIAVISKVARALHQAHQQGVIHRDLKPANIMIDDEGEPVVMDFGLARRDTDDDQPQLTQAGQIMGTPAYMPPEQISGRTEEMGPPCDIYALGVILYELLTGKRPFDGNLMQLMSQIALESPPALRTINDQIDPQLESIVLKSLEKQPGDRWESMLAFADALEACQPKSMPSKEPPKRRWPLIAAGLLGIIGLVFAAVILLRVETSEGTIVLEIDQPELAGAVVSVDGQKKITIKTGEGKEPIEITADEKTHTLKVTKGGFETFTKQFSVKAGKQETIRVRLEAVAKAKPAPTPLEPKPPALPKDIELVAEPVQHKPNEPLSLLALVRDPAPLEGALSWTLQTRHHRTPVNCVQFSPDGSLMATGGSDGTIRLWDYPSNQLKQIISTQSSITELEFSPGGRYFASVGLRFSSYGSPDPHAEIRETTTGRLVKRFPQKAAYRKKYAIAWHPQGERFATIDNADILIWNLQSGIKAKRLKGHSSHIAKVAWSADGDWFATASESEVIFWNTSNWTEQIRLTPKHRISHLSFSPQSNLLAISGFDKGTLGLWKVPEGELALPAFQSGETSAITFSPDGTKVITAEKSTNIIRCWNVSNGEATAEFASTSNVRNMAVSRDGKGLIFVGDEVRRRDLKTGENSLVFPPCNIAIESPWWLPHEPELGLSIQGSPLWKIKLTQNPSIRQLDLRIQGSHPSRVSLSPNGRYFLTSFGDYTSRIYDWESEEILTTTRLAYRFTWSPDGRRIAFNIGDSNTMRLTEVATGNVIRSFDTKSKIHELAYSRDGKHLAIQKNKSDASKERVEVWDVETGELVQSIFTPYNWDMAQMAWSVDNQTIAVREGWGTCLYDVKTGNKIVFLEYEAGSGSGAQGNIHFYQDGRTVSIQRGDERMLVYDLAATRKKNGCLDPIHVRQFGHGTFFARWSTNDTIVAIEADSHHVSFYDPLKDLELGTLTPVQTEGQAAALFVDANGYYQVIGKLNDELLFNVLRNDGTVQTLTAAEFETQYGWKNDPAKAKLIDSIINTYPDFSDSKQAESPPSP